VVGLRFAPGTAPTVLGVPADEVRDARVELGELWGPGPAGRAHDRVAGAPRRGRALEQLAGRLVEDTPPPSWVARAADRCDAGWSTREVADELGWSERTLHRRARHAFGYGTATLTRILRFRRATALIRAGRPLGEVAADTGYADQPHLSREVRALSGRSPVQLRG
jgi:AraC-like DNA-binding protein